MQMRREKNKRAPAAAKADDKFLLTTKPLGVPLEDFQHYGSGGRVNLQMVVSQEIPERGRPSVVCREYASKNGIRVIDSYIDRALSASKDTDKRLDFQRMIRDSGKHPLVEVGCGLYSYNCPWGWSVRHVK